MSYALKPFQTHRDVSTTTHTSCEHVDFIHISKELIGFIYSGVVNLDMLLTVSTQDFENSTPEVIWDSILEAL